ncbi:hypothetical protein JZX87_03465 [Agrobacterium sp. Ap1]|uniref:hypothetical protein n=1 Tax=Agrobacterium sp. Ap1 TaxID=2815337 RepID=UPI001A8C85F6|nr:hypothetical protein [Agrobacterium sp. Ap1]MBO0140225.1 hypothetical protein [Agrobacterium sp. Ap1]
MSAHLRQQHDAIDHLNEASAIMRIAVLAADSFSATPGEEHVKVLCDIGRAIDGSRRLTELAVLLLDDVSDSLRDMP